MSKQSQRIKINGTLSDSFDLNFGVPQGSCCGPVLFSVYCRQLMEVVKGHLPKVHGYADDHQLYLSFRPGDEEEAALAMENCVRDVRHWMLQNKLKINDGKTDVLVIGTKQQLAKVQLENIRIGEDIIKCSEMGRNLGIWLDVNMNLTKQINETKTS